MKNVEVGPIWEIHACLHQHVHSEYLLTELKGQKVDNYHHGDNNHHGDNDHLVFLVRGS